jgi:hypothetical protein
MASPFEDELETIINEYAEKRKNSQEYDYSDVFSDVEVTSFIARCIAAGERATGREIYLL